MTASTRPSPPSGTAALHLRQRRVLAILPMLALRAVRGSGWLRALHCLRRTAAVRTLCGRRTDGCLWRGLLLPSGWPSHPPQSTGNHLEAPGSLSTPLAGTQLRRDPLRHSWAGADASPGASQDRGIAPTAELHFYIPGKLTVDRSRKTLDSRTSPSLDEDFRHGPKWR